MLQLSRTRDCFYLNVVPYDKDETWIPEEYHHYFKDYQYIAVEQAEQMLLDEFVSDSDKQALRKVLK